MAFSLILPKRDGTDGNEKLDLENNTLVIVGANGSGKSRLGAWIDRCEKENQGEKTHRISAMRHIQYKPNNIQIKSPDNLKSMWTIGDTGRRWKDKFSFRWQSKPTISQIQDFDTIISLLFSDDYRLSKEKNTDNRQSALVKTEDAWNIIFPQRKMSFNISKFEPEISFDKNQYPDHHIAMDRPSYSGTQMSDGERVALYLLAQCYLADSGTILIIDEPENHLHKAAIYDMWNHIEADNPDKLFVYITHDLEFAASRIDAKKIWVKSYTQPPDTWNWELIEDSEALPQELVFHILGSRKPVIFVEGTISSLDYPLYKRLFPYCLIISCDSGEKVVENTKAFRAIPNMHHLEAYGIVDRDRKQEGEIEKLKQDGIFVLTVAEVENFYCLPEIVQSVAEFWGNHVSSQVAIKQSQKRLFELITRNLEEQILRRVEYIIENRIRREFGGKHKDYEALSKKLQALSNTDTESIKQESVKLFQNAISSQNYLEGLKLYNQKGFITEIAYILHLSRDQYIHIANKRLAEDKQLREAIKHYFPEEMIALLG